MSVILLSYKIYTSKRFKEERGKERRHRLIVYSPLLMSTSLNYLFLLYDWGGRNMEGFANECHSALLIKYSESGGLVWNSCFLFVWKRKWWWIKFKKKRGGIKSKYCILYSVMCGVLFFLVNVFSECLTILFEIILWLYNIMAAFCSNVALWGKDSLVSRELCTTASVLRKHS